MGCSARQADGGGSVRANGGSSCRRASRRSALVQAASAGTPAITSRSTASHSGRVDQMPMSADRARSAAASSCSRQAGGARSTRPDRRTCSTATSAASGADHLSIRVATWIRSRGCQPRSHWWPAPLSRRALATSSSRASTSLSSPLSSRSTSREKLLGLVLIVAQDINRSRWRPASWSRSRVGTCGRARSAVRPASPAASRRSSSPCCRSRSSMSSDGAGRGGTCPDGVGPRRARSLCLAARRWRLLRPMGTVKQHAPTAAVLVHRRVGRCPAARPSDRFPDVARGWVPAASRACGPPDVAPRWVPAAPRACGPPHVAPRWVPAAPPTCPALGASYVLAFRAQTKQ